MFATATSLFPGQSASASDKLTSTTGDDVWRLAGLTVGRVVGFKEDVLVGTVDGGLVGSDVGDGDSPVGAFVNI